MDELELDGVGGTRKRRKTDRLTAAASKRRLQPLFLCSQLTFRCMMHASQNPHPIPHLLDKSSSRHPLLPPPPGPSKAADAAAASAAAQHLGIVSRRPSRDSASAPHSRHDHARECLCVQCVDAARTTPTTLTSSPSSRSRRCHPCAAHGNVVDGPSCARGRLIASGKWAERLCATVWAIK